MVEVPGERERDAILDFVVKQQADPTRRVAAVGLERAGIALELDELEPPWADTVRVVRTGEAITGACIVEWDVELNRAWLVGPWVEGEVDSSGWLAAARALADAAIAQAPATVTQFEVAGETVATGLAALAAELGWAPTEANHVLIADAPGVEGWPDQLDRTVVIRAAAQEDVTAIAAMHDAEFPGTYASTERLVAEALAGDRLTIVATAPDDLLVGYASGQAHADGEGFIDFVGVLPDARRSGVGTALVRELSRLLLTHPNVNRIALTVQDHRHAARAMYARMDFRLDGAIVAYRSWT